MYHIAVLTKSETQETFYREQLSRFCAERGLFPKVDCYRGQEVFFEVARKNAPTNAVISLPAWTAECSGAPAGAFPGNAHHLVQRAGFFPACVPAARRLLSAGADNGRSIPAWALCMGRGKTTVCFAPSGSQPTWQGGSPMKKRNPIYTAGSFLLAGALTCRWQPAAEHRHRRRIRRHLPLQQHRLRQPHLLRKRPLPRRYPAHSP